jgi:hypothetical protein
MVYYSIDNPTNNTTMIEPAAGPAAWLLGFQPPHPRSLSGRGRLRAGLKGLVSFYNLTKKKNKYSTQQFYSSFYLQSKFNAPKSCYCTSPVPTTQLHILSILSPIAGICFWLIVVCKMIDQRPPKATMYFILLIFLSSDLPPQTIGWCTPTRSPPNAPPL